MQFREPPCVGGVASHPVQGTAAGGGDQPGQRLLRDTALRPGAQRRLHRLLGGVLGQFQVPEAAHQGGQQSREIGRASCRGRGADGGGGGAGQREQRGEEEKGR